MSLSMGQVGSAFLRRLNGAGTKCDWNSRAMSPTKAAETRAVFLHLSNTEPVFAVRLGQASNDHPWLMERSMGTDPDRTLARSGGSISSTTAFGRGFI